MATQLTQYTGITPQALNSTAPANTVTAGSYVQVADGTYLISTGLSWVPYVLSISGPGEVLVTD